jgi:hypothetical protein
LLEPFSFFGRGGATIAWNVRAIGEIAASPPLRGFKGDLRSTPPSGFPHIPEDRISGQHISDRTAIDGGRKDLAQRDVRDIDEDLFRDRRGNPFSVSEIGREQPVVAEGFQSFTGRPAARSRLAIAADRAVDSGIELIGARPVGVEDAPATLFGRILFCQTLQHTTSVGVLRVHVDAGAFQHVGADIAQRFQRRKIGWDRQHRALVLVARRGDSLGNGGEVSGLVRTSMPACVAIGVPGQKTPTPERQLARPPAAAGM